MWAMEALPATLYFVLLELAAGGLVVLLLVQLRNEVSQGFAVFTGLMLWTSAALALWLRSSFPPSSWPYAPEPRWLGLEAVLLAALVVVGGLYLISVLVRASAIRLALGGVTALAAVATLVVAALVQAGPQVGGLGAPLSVVVGAVSLGAAVDGLTLGHWYLVTPKLPSLPLLRMTRVLLAALAAQVLLLPVLLVTANAGPGQVLAQMGLFFWLRLGFGLAFPLVLGVLVWKTASMRSMQSATGLLYVLASLVFSGEIISRSIFFLTGVAV